MLTRCRIPCWWKQFSPRIHAHSRFSATRRERSPLSSRRNLNSKGEYSTGASDSGNNTKNNGPIVSQSESPWDHVFDDIQETPPLLRTRSCPSRNPELARNTDLARIPDMETSTQARIRRESMTAHSRFSATRRERSPLSSRRNSNSKREYSTGASDSGTNTKNNGPIFSQSESSWDHVFDDIQKTPPLLRARSRPSRNPELARNADMATSTQSRIRRQSMTAREINAFDEMFNMIFNAVSDHPNITSNTSDVGIGRAPFGKGSQMQDFFSKMRGHSRKMKWSAQSDGDLDRKKEEMDLCDTDHQLLEWAMREVFDESKRYEQAARKAVADMAEGVEPEKMPELQPAIYPHLIALLIRTFRDKFRDPHLALSMFDHARHLSIPSYVFGCTTPAYNELIETRWGCFRDLKGVHDALEEMTVNGVQIDPRTKALVETVRREVGERNKWEEENEMGSGEVWTMLTKIDELMIRHGPQVRRGALGHRRHPSGEAWKHSKDLDDDWEFGKWEDLEGRGPGEMSNRGFQSSGGKQYDRSSRERRNPDRNF